MPEYRRILLDGSCVQVRRDGAELVAGDGRRVAAEDAVHLPPVVPSKIVAVHLNHRSRVTEFGATLPPAPTYFHKPTSAMVGHGGAVVRPAGCTFLNYEGEVAIVIGRVCRGVPPSQGIRSPTTSGCTTSATPTRAPCSASRAPTRWRRSAPGWSPTGISSVSG